MNPSAPEPPCEAVSEVPDLPFEVVVAVARASLRCVRDFGATALVAKHALALRLVCKAFASEFEFYASVYHPDPARVVEAVFQAATQFAKTGRPCSLSGNAFLHVATAVGERCSPRSKQASARLLYHALVARQFAVVPRAPALGAGLPPRESLQARQYSAHALGALDRGFTKQSRMLSVRALMGLTPMH